MIISDKKIDNDVKSFSIKEMSKIIDLIEKYKKTHN